MTPRPAGADLDHSFTIKTMKTSVEMMKSYGKVTTFQDRFFVLGLGILFFLFPGLVIHLIIEGFENAIGEERFSAIGDMINSAAAASQKSG